MSTSDTDKSEKDKEGKPEGRNGRKMRKGSSEDDRDAKTALGKEVEEGETAASLAEESRAERKRHREKKRRSDVNKGLDQLMELVFIIDPQLKFEAEERAKKASGGRSSNSDAPLLSRVELINSAVVTLERVYRENEERKMVIAHLAGGLLAGNGGGGPLASVPGVGLASNMLSSLPLARDIQRQQELQRQLNLDALMAASAGAQQPLRGNVNAALTPEAAALGLGSPLRRGAASLVRPSRPVSDIPLGGLNSAAGSLLSAASSQQGITDGTSLLSNLDGEGPGVNQALYRALLNRRLQEEESAALAAAGLGAAGGSLGGMGILGRMNPSLLSRPGESLGLSAQLPGDSIRQAMMREQTIAQAAEANAAMANEDGPVAKKFKSYLS